jgi:hypothetical protein
MNLKEALLTQAPSLALQRAAADEISRLLAVIEQCRWRPIETAPKDGATILVSAGGFVYAVAWDDDIEWWAVDDNKNGPYRLRGVSPTQWMPAPKP